MISWFEGLSILQKLFAAFALLGIFPLVARRFTAMVRSRRALEGFVRPRKIDYNLVVVDTPPALDSASLAAVIPVADYVLLPTPPAPMDLAALITTVNEAVSPSGVSHRVLLTKVDSRSVGEAIEAQNTLLELNIPACNAFIRAYKAHERAALEGISILKWRGKNAQEARSDYCRVAEEIQRDWKQP